MIGKTIGRWLNAESGSPAIFFSDSQDYILASGTDDAGALPWQDTEGRESNVHGQPEESPLSLVAVDEKRPFGRIHELTDDEMTRMSDGSSEVDDTFRFRKFVS